MLFMIYKFHKNTVLIVQNIRILIVERKNGKTIYYSF